MHLPTEDDVSRVVPPGTLMDAWVQLGKATSDGHSIMHVGSYLAMMSVVAPLCRLDATWAENSSCLYVIVGGEKGARDGTSASELKDALKNAGRPFMVVTENLLDKITGPRCQALNHVLHEIWEGRDVRGYHNRTTTGARNPRLSLLSHVPVRTLRNDLYLSHMESSIMRDHLVLLASGRERQADTAMVGRTRDRPELLNLQQGLHALLTRQVDQDSVHHAYIATDAAAKSHAEWVEALEAQCRAHDLGSYMARAKRMAERIAMILSWDFGTARTHCDQNLEWPIGAAEISTAFSLVYHLHLPGIWHLQRFAARTEEMRIRERILAFLDGGKSWVVEGEIYKELQATKREIWPVIETLVAEQTIISTAYPTSSDVVVTAYRINAEAPLSSADIAELHASKGAGHAARQPVPIATRPDVRAGNAQLIPFPIQDER